jgi:hypothetical protein
MAPPRKDYTQSPNVAFLLGFADSIPKESREIPHAHPVGVPANNSPQREEDPKETLMTNTASRNTNILRIGLFIFAIMVSIAALAA